MDNLPIGPMLGVLALLILWSGLLTAVDAAHQYLKAARPNGRATDTATPKLAFELGSLILSNTLIKVLITIISMLLALHFWNNNGPTLAWIGVSSALLIFAEFIPRTLAARYPEAILILGNSLLRLPMTLLSPLTWLFSAIACTLLRPFGIAAKPKARKKDTDVPQAIWMTRSSASSNN